MTFLCNNMLLLFCGLPHSNISFSKIPPSPLDRPVTKPTSRHVAKWTSKRRMRTQKRMVSYTWKHQQRMRTMSGSYLWILPRLYQSPCSNRIGRLFLSCHRSRSREIAADRLYCFGDLVYFRFSVCVERMHGFWGVRIVGGGKLSRVKF